MLSVLKANFSTSCVLSPKCQYIMRNKKWHATLEVRFVAVWRALLGKVTEVRILLVALATFVCSKLVALKERQVFSVLPTCRRSVGSCRTADYVSIGLTFVIGAVTRILHCIAKRFHVRCDFVQICQNPVLG